MSRDTKGVRSSRIGITLDEYRALQRHIEKTQGAKRKPGMLAELATMWPAHAAALTPRKGS